MSNLNIRKYAINKINDIINRTNELKEHGKLEDILVSFGFLDGHVHVVYPKNEGITKETAKRISIDKDEIISELIASDSELEMAPRPNRKILLRQGQSPGDILSMTRALSDLKKSYPNWSIDVRSPCQEIFENCPHLTPLKEGDPDVEIFNITYDDINISGWHGLHFTDAFRNDLERKLKVPIKKTGIRPELWISDLEKSWINQVEVEFGWKGPFWVLNAGRKPDNELKQYHRWQEVVDILNWHFKDKVKIVQIGHKDHIHPKLNGILDLVGKTDQRQLIRLCHWAHGTIGPISFQFVISAALEQPAVCVAGGKEGVRWHIYPHIKYLYSNGSLLCCKWDGCWLGGAKGKCDQLVEGVPKCFSIIEPYMVSDACLSYYRGGALSMEKRER